MKEIIVKKSGPIVVWLFFLSGAAGLMYEIIWTRMLTMYVGGSAFSVSIVLTVFMAGLALGSAIAGKFADRLDGPERLLLFYGGMEVAVGLYGLLFPILISAGKPLYALVYHRLLDNFLEYNMASALISALLLIVPTTLMGATLPLLCRFIINDLSRTGRHTGQLYGMNTLGAAMGACLCGFWLIGRWGIIAALLTAVTVNVVIGFFCILYLVPAIKEGRRVLTPDKTIPPQAASVKGTPPRRFLINALPLYAILAVSAFCAMSYEVIWTKLIALLVGPTTYSFTIVLFTFITGLAMGSALFGRLADRSRNPFGLLVVTQLAGAAFVLAASHFLGNSQIFFAKVIYQLRHNFILLEAVKTGLLFAVMVVPTIFLGAVIPAAVRIRVRSIALIGASVGSLYAISTVGAFLGAFCAGFILVPLFGKAAGISTLVAIQVVTVLMCSLPAGRHRPQRRVLTVGVAAVIFTASLFLPGWDGLTLSRGKYLRPDLYGTTLENMSFLESIFQGPKRLSHLSTDKDIIWIDDGIGGLVAVGKTINSLGTPVMFLSVDGKIVTSTLWDLNMMVTAGHLPLMLHQNAKKALVVGLGSGLTAGEMLHYPLERLDIVEISPEVVKACHLFAPFHNNLLIDPRTHIIVQDARTHIALTDQKYDVIVADPINPWMAGSANLFTLDHFRRVKERLNPGGIFVQWFHAYQSDWNVFSMFGRTFRQAFPNSLLVNTAVLGQDYLFVGFKDDHGPMLDSKLMEANLPYAQKSAHMRISSPSVIYPLIVTDIPASLFTDGRLHTDNHPYMEYLAPRHAYTGGSDFRKDVLEKRQRSPLLQSRLSQFSNINHQIAFADFMASLNIAPFGLVRLDEADPSQTNRYRQIVESYCRVNLIEDYSRLGPLDRDICLPVQKQCILARIDQLTGKDGQNWLLGAAYFDLAGIYAAGQDFPSAISYYRQGLTLLPDHQMALSNLAACYEQLQAYDKAIDILHRLASIQPGSAKLMTRLAANHLKRGNQVDALRYIEEALRYNKRYVPALVTAGMIYGTKGDFTRAVSYSQKALVIDPESVNAYQNIAVALSRLGRTEEALAYIKRGLEVAPTNRDLMALRDTLLSLNF